MAQAFKLVARLFPLPLLSGQCKKNECFSNYDCKIGDHCDGGFCEPKPGFCMKDGDCAKGQCSAGKGKRGAECQELRKPGAWCPLQVNNSQLNCSGSDAPGNRYILIKIQRQNEMCMLKAARAIFTCEGVATTVSLGPVHNCLSRTRLPTVSAVRNATYYVGITFSRLSVI